MWEYAFFNGHISMLKLFQSSLMRSDLPVGHFSYLSNLTFIKTLLLSGDFELEPTTESNLFTTFIKKTVNN